MYGDEFTNSLVGCPPLPLGFGFCRCFCGDEVTRVLVPAVFRGDGGCFAALCVLVSRLGRGAGFPLGLVRFGCLVCRWCCRLWCGVFGSCPSAVADPSATAVVKCCLRPCHDVGVFVVSQRDGY
ncbi:unnamed protein product [Absidia cylindrospora]